MKIKVTFMSGAGNLFSVIDNRKYKFNVNQGKILAELFCNKNEFNDFKTEGLMFLENGKDYLDFECKFYNPDGSTGMMCGNGGRAITRFAELSGILKNKVNINFLMSGDIYHSEIEENDIKLYMPPARANPYKLNLQTSDKEYNGFFSNTGTNHYVLDTTNSNLDFNDFDINKLGSELRFHKEFAPIGSNINFVKIEDKILHLRTFEKGVEAETGACGTGAVAVGLTYNHFFNFDFPITIIPSSKEMLTIDVVKNGDTIINMILQGPAKILFESEFNINDSKLLI